VISAYLSAQGHIVAALVFLKEVRGDQFYGDEIRVCRQVTVRAS
jgi:hypothetical protein